MDNIKAVLTCWSFIGGLGVLVAWLRVDPEARRDAGARRSLAVSLAYALCTGLSAQDLLPSPPIPGWWCWAVAPLGAVIMILGQALGWWAKKGLGSGFSVRLPPRAASVMTGGAYRICRHPMALGFLMTWVGTAIMLGSPAMLIVFGFASILVMQRVALEEGRLEEMFGEEYLRYRKRVPMIAPCTDAECEAELERAVKILRDRGVIATMGCRPRH